MAAADLNAIRATIEGRLAAELALPPVIPVVFNNSDYKPTLDRPWVQCLVTFGVSDYLTFGGTVDSSNLIIGLVTFNIFTPIKVGSGSNYVIGKRIRDLYNRVIVSGVYFDAPSGPDVAVSTAPEGFFQTQVQVTFEFIEDL
jgi:hypothetical protein